MKTFLPMAVLAALAAFPALGQTTSDTTTMPRSERERSMQEQAQRPDQRQQGEIQELRDKGMTSPDVQGQAVPENPNTGVPEAQERGAPKRELEGRTPRP
ncbi:MAG TPA: hypothetical protein VL974_08410 [Magnetospirillum sp.]|jgi:hypothetical protein|nr:hypothetical protein [Magnetospirillum sp.]